MCTNKLKRFKKPFALQHLFINFENPIIVKLLKIYLAQVHLEWKNVLQSQKFIIMNIILT